MQVSLALWRGVPARCAVPAPESAKRHTRKVPPIGGSRNCPNRAKAQPGGELGSFQPAISPRLPKCGHCLWMLPERKDGAGLAQPIRMHTLHCVWLRLLADAIFKLTRCSWRGSNPRPWAHKTHALTTRPQERDPSHGSLVPTEVIAAVRGPTGCDKTVLYTGSVFEYIRAWRFQPLAQGQSRMMIRARPTPFA